MHVNVKLLKLQEEWIHCNLMMTEYRFITNTITCKRWDVLQRQVNGEEATNHLKWVVFISREIPKSIEATCKEKMGLTDTINTKQSFSVDNVEGERPKHLSNEVQKRSFVSNDLEPAILKQCCFQINKIRFVVFQPSVSMGMPFERSPHWKRAWWLFTILIHSYTQRTVIIHTHLKEEVFWVYLVSSFLKELERPIFRNKNGDM